MGGDDFAYTDKDGNIHIRDDVPAERVDEVLGHELTHAMKRKGFEPYIEFAKEAVNRVDLTSDAGIKLIGKTAAHRGIDITKPLTDDQLLTISDEIAALVRGAEKSGHVEDVIGDLRDAFEDYDAFAAELASIHEAYIAEAKDTQPKRDGVALPYADALREIRAQAPQTYADALRELQKPTPYADEFRKYLDELGGFREP